MAYLFRVLALFFLTTSCQRPAIKAAADCIDPARVNPNGMCTMEYNPVCGCNGQTYTNPCAAANAGVLSYTTGACPTHP